MKKNVISFIQYKSAYLYDFVLNWMQMQEKKLLILKHIKSEKRFLSMSRNLIEIHDQK